MDIVFSMSTEVITADEGPSFSRKDWKAVLRYKTDSQILEFWGIHPEKKEALRQAFESFLQDKPYIYQPVIGFRFIIPGEKYKVRIENFPPEYQELIWQLIDAKYGMDNVLKITS